MQITIDIDEEAAACIWANRTWSGKDPRKLSDIVKGLAEEEAGFYRRAFPKAVPHAIEGFRLQPDEIKQ